MFVPTRSSLSKADAPNTFETVVFQSRKKRERTLKQEEIERKPAEINKKEDSKLDMRKLRYEVIKFGTSGFEGAKKEESRVALAVALGAKPPKKKYRNYVEILKEKKAKPDIKSTVAKPKLTKLSAKGAKKHKKGIKGSANQKARTNT